MSELGLGTLYDMNKIAVKQEGRLSKRAMKDGLELAKTYFKDEDNMYYMLLCHEKRDYTVFRIADSVDEAVAALKDCITNRGVCYSFDKDKVGGGLEIWIEIDKEMYCYYLFPYDNAIIEC